MATATALFTIRYEISGDECEDAEPWNIYSPDGEFEACFETKAEALAHAAECNESLEDESEEEARGELADALQEKIAEMSLAELRKLAKRLGI